MELSSGTTRPWRDESGRLWIQADAVVGALPAGETGFGNALRYAFGAMRGRIHRSIGNTIHVVAGRAAPLLLALILGEAGEIDPRVNLLFRRAGAVHLLALSGMHLAVIALLVRALVRPLAGPAVAGWTAVAAGLFYVALAGPRPGLVRAFILIALSTLFRSVDHRRPLIELLAATFLIQLVLQPGAASSLGFQLSYLSLLGIALLATQLGGLVGQHVPPALASPLAAGAGAQLFTAPLLLSRFGSWYPVGIVSSAVMGPLVLVVMTVGIVAVVLYSAGLRMIVPVVRPLLESLSDTATAMSWFFSGSPAVHPSGSLRYWVVAASALAGMVCAMGLRNTYRGRT